MNFHGINAAFQKRIDYWNNLAAKNDPYGIATPMRVALEEVRFALLEAVDAPDNTLPGPPGVEREPPRDRHLPGTELPIK